MAPVTAVLSQAECPWKEVQRSAAQLSPALAVNGVNEEEPGREENGEGAGELLRGGH